MKQTAIVIILLLMQFSTNYACLNGDTKILTNGVIVYEGRPDGVPKGRQILYNDEMLEAEIRELDI